MVMNKKEREENNIKKKNYKKIKGMTGIFI